MMGKCAGKFVQGGIKGKLYKGKCAGEMCSVGNVADGDVVSMLSSHGPQ